MAVLAYNNPTLNDVIKATDPNGNIGAVAELLSQKNEILQDMTVIEGNLATGHQSIVRTGIPEPTWRKLYQGVSPTKSDRAKIVDTTGILEAYAEVDKDVAMLNGNSAQFRLSEDKAHIEGMSQTMAKTLIYGNETAQPEAFTGLAPRFNSRQAANAENIVSAGGTGATNTSIWLVNWSPETVFSIYPKGSKAGLEQQDLGEVTLYDQDGSPFQGYRSHYQWKMGLVVKDWRAVGRIANIDAAKLSDETYVKTLIKHMITLSETVETGGGRPVFYINKRVRTALRLGILEKIAANLAWETVAGKPVMRFDDIPVRRVDRILNTEAALV